MKYKKYITEARKYTVEEVAEMADEEELSYMIRSYLSWTKIEDKELAKQWKIAGDALNKIERILGR